MSAESIAPHVLSLDNYTNMKIILHFDRQFDGNMGVRDGVHFSCLDCVRFPSSYVSIRFCSPVYIACIFHPRNAHSSSPNTKNSSCYEQTSSRDAHCVISSR